MAIISFRPWPFHARQVVKSYAGLPPDTLLEATRTGAELAEYLYTSVPSALMDAFHTKWAELQAKSARENMPTNEEIDRQNREYARHNYSSPFED